MTRVSAEGTVGQGAGLPTEGLPWTDARVSLQGAPGSLDRLGRKERQVSWAEGAISCGGIILISLVWCFMTRKAAAGLDPSMGKRR